MDTVCSNSSIFVGLGAAKEGFEGVFRDPKVGRNLCEAQTRLPHFQQTSLFLHSHKRLQLRHKAGLALLLCALTFLDFCFRVIMIVMKKRRRP